MKNIILIGMSGCGKSTLGAAAAEYMGLKFVDMDSYVAQSVGMSIDAIFAQMGEGYFRGLEAAAAAIICQTSGQLIAAGGGFVLRENNITEARKNSVFVFIDRPIDEIACGYDYASRPLTPDEAALRALYAGRREKYLAAADHILVPHGSIEQSVLQLCELVAGIFLQAPRFAVIGEPVANSLSPQIHLPVLQHFCESPDYLRIPVNSAGLDDFIAYARKTGLDGFNVTMPHKNAVISRLDEIEEDARFVASVNTVLNKSGRLCGFNTDITGFLHSLQHNGFDFEGKTMLLAGAGGAARAAAYAAAVSGIGRICVCDMDRKLADDLCRMVKKVDPHIETIAEDIEKIAEQASDADLFVNATPLGMADGPQWQSLEFVGRLPENAFVFDMIYCPRQTELLRAASRRGLRDCNGLDMLIFQAIAADEIYLGIELDAEAFYQKIVTWLNTLQ